MKSRVSNLSVQLHGSRSQNASDSASTTTQPLSPSSLSRHQYQIHSALSPHDDFVIDNVLGAFLQSIKYPAVIVSKDKSSNDLITRSAIAASCNRLSGLNSCHQPMISRSLGGAHADTLDLTILHHNQAFVDCFGFVASGMKLNHFLPHSSSSTISSHKYSSPTTSSHHHGHRELRTRRLPKVGHTSIMQGVKSDDSLFHVEVSLSELDDGLISISSTNLHTASILVTMRELSRSEIQSRQSRYQSEFEGLFHSKFFLISFALCFAGANLLLLLQLLVVVGLGLAMVRVILFLLLPLPLLNHQFS